MKLTKGEWDTIDFLIQKENIPMGLIRNKRKEMYFFDIQNQKTLSIPEGLERMKEVIKVKSVPQKEYLDFTKILKKYYI